MSYKPNLAGPWVDVRSFAPSDKPRDNYYSNDPNFNYDWYQPIQDAIDYLLSQPANGDTGTLYLPPGWYRISKPLRVRKPLPTEGNPNVFFHERCSIHIVGDAPGYGVGVFHGTAITCDFADAPALILQSVRATKIENICFRGKNNQLRHERRARRPLLAPRRHPHRCLRPRGPLRAPIPGPRERVHCLLRK